MRIHSVRIQQLRTFKDVTVALDDYTCLVGPNGAGKSTVLCALNIFFRDTDHSPVDLTCLEEQDFHNRETGTPIEITVIFRNLSTEAQEDFKDYYRNGELVVTAKAAYDPERGALVRHYGQRSAMKAFAPYFEAYNGGKSAADLKEIYTKLREDFPDLRKVTTKEGTRESLRDYETAHPELCELLQSEDQFYGVSKGANRLAKYLQWVYVPAVKDAVSEELGEKNTALSKLVERVVRARVNFHDPIKAIRATAQREYEKVLSANQAALAEVSGQLASLVTEYAHPDAKCRIAWTHDPEKSITIETPVAAVLAGEGEFEGGIARFGHGLQRSLLLGLLQLVSGSGDTEGPKLILGIEEPELFQHPPQARHLAEVFQNLSEKNAQIIVSTHSPYFVVGKGVESVRMVRKNPLTRFSTVSQVTYNQVSTAISTASGDLPYPRPEGMRARLHQELQPARNEIFFSPIVILVEGLEDVANIKSHLHLTGKWQDFRKLGCHIVPAEGKSHMSFALAVMQHLQIPFFVIWDSDSNQKNRDQHEKENRTILKLCGEETANPFPSSHTFTDNYILWKVNMAATVDEDLGAPWEQIKNETRNALGSPGALEKNSVFIAECLASAYSKGLKSANLERLCNSILNFARRSSLEIANANIPLGAMPTVPPT